MILAEIARVSGFSKSKAFRVLYTLEKKQYVERETICANKLGVRSQDFGRHVQDQLDVRVTARPILDWLAEKTRESVFLGVRMAMKRSALKPGNRLSRSASSPEWGNER